MNFFEKQLDELLKTDPAFIVTQNGTRFDKLAGNFAESIVLVGAGEVGRNTLAGLLDLGIAPLAFADNNHALWGKAVNGLTVFSLHDAVQRFGGKAVFVVTIYNSSTVRRQLRDLNCPIVVPFAYLYWKYAEIFLPYCSLDLPHEIYAQVNDVRKVLSLWADDISHHEFLAQIKWRLSLDSDSMPSPLPMQQLYFPLDLIALSSDEVFVDCGAFDGASITSFIQHSGADFRRLIALEPDPSNFQKLQKYILSLPANLKDRVVAFQIAAGQKKGIAHFEVTGTVVSRVTESGEIEVGSAPLDDILQECSPTYIKMDIEGSELDALTGACETIKHADTVWAICAYHKQEDLWKIPLFIKSISDDYCFYLRRYAEECWELVCYAIPAKRICSTCQS